MGLLPFFRCASIYVTPFQDENNYTTTIQLRVSVDGWSEVRRCDVEETHIGSRISMWLLNSGDPAGYNAMHLTMRSISFMVFLTSCGGMPRLTVLKRFLGIKLIPTSGRWPSTRLSSCLIASLEVYSSEVHSSTYGWAHFMDAVPPLTNLGIMHHEHDT